MIRTHVKLGQFRCEAQLQTLVETVDQYGQPVQDWDDTGDPIPCEIRTATGRDAANAEQLKVTLSHVVTMWYQGDENGVATISTTQQLVVEGRTFAITWINDVDNRHIQHKVYCTEQVGTNE